MNTQRTLETPHTFGARLRELRTQRGWTQAQLADFAGITNTVLWAYENNRGGITLYTLGKLACALEISLSELVEGVAA